MAATVFELLGKISLKDEEFKKQVKESSKSIQTFGNKLGNVIASVAKVGAAAAAAVGAVGIAVAKQSFEAYAEYEQLAGGAQLLFGDAYDFVAAKAANAYKNVQMSQNEYLQQVNGFAVGLKTALGGNEQEAARLADRIITAEADIVAATGNTQENVQNAFNGIMKSNFSMLDNLQIGITPTKEGFQEVIDKVNEWNAANGNATKYQIDNLADCQMALLDYIDMQGLSGYAADEAAKTISGSIAMTKASWSNLLTAFADENADLGEWAYSFMESVAITAGNVVPRVIQIFQGIVQALPEVISIAKEMLFEAFPELEAKINSIEQWISKYSGLLAGLAVAIGVVTAAIGLHNAVMAVKLAMDAAHVTSLGALIAAKLASAAATMVALAPYVLIVAAIAAVIAIIVLCVQHWDQIKAKVAEVAQNISAFMQALRDDVVDSWNNMKENVATAVDSLRSKVQTIFEDIKQSITDKINSAKEAVGNAIEKIKGFLDFSWSLPALALPHFSVSGGEAPWGFGGKGSLPSVSVEWYAKGGIMNDPTIFGFNPFTGKAMGGGEAGAEAIAPISTLKQYVTEAVNEAGSASVLREIANILSEFRNSGMPINIDISTELDGATVARKLYKYNLLEQRNHGTSLINA